MSELISLQNVMKTFRQRRRVITAVDDVSLVLSAGEILCLVGESGSGKSTIGRIVTGLTEPTAGVVRYGDASAKRATRKELRAHRLGVQMIQQDPYASLHPGLTVAQALAAPLRRHFHMSRAEARHNLSQLLVDVGLTPADAFWGKYPHELSGGQRQRVAIARSLTVEPRALVADEAVSMLDVSIRVSVLQMLRRLCDERQLAVLFITHDLAVARQFARGHSIAVMRAGRIVEHRPTDELVAAPEDPYTLALLRAARHDGLRGQSSRDRGESGASHDVTSSSTRAPEALLDQLNGAAKGARPPGQEGPSPSDATGSPKPGSLP